jgi:hypothetical protein
MLRTASDRVLVGFADARHKPERVAARTTCQLKPGDQIVLSPLPKAVPGMQLVRRDAEQHGEEGRPVALSGDSPQSIDARVCP